LNKAFININILDSVNNELRNIESKRQKLLGDLIFNQKKIEDAKTELKRQEMELDKIKISVKQVNLINYLLLIYYIFLRI